MAYFLAKGGLATFSYLVLVGGMPIKVTSQVACAADMIALDVKWSISLGGVVVIRDFLEAYDLIGPTKTTVRLYRCYL
ncbi:hypothetical protein N7537_010283 [Penicillium hordei]|uniref:Uncharacterized protein n=1 Tax=Penicillium hordei TaxID=40994 RepID=A0AAD6DVS8_9EURO|nr:uncharacterized protein N7537_010283 [Penicillium hordei]KAJ5593379.1 hypothetical protein N7537_010283 [Penicillium hordei]